jgi:Kef-type K+ transport system membrane component KefB
MTRIAALALAIAAVAWVHQLGPGSDLPSAGTALAVGFTLLGAWITGELLRRFQLPRLTGYLLFGVLVGPYIGNVITASMTSQLHAVTGIATTLIALIAGLTISLERLGNSLSAIARLTATTLAIVVIGIGTLAWFAWSWLPVAPESGGMERAVIVGLLTIMAASVSPTMTAAVTTETGARGRLSELVLAVVVLADLVLLVLFSFAMQVARAVFRADAGFASPLVQFAWETGGAVAFGALVGALFALYLRYVGREVTLVLLAVCALLSQVGTTQQFGPLLAAVAAGLVIENVSVSQGEALKAAVQRGAPPVLVMFFVAIGSSLRMDALMALGPVALGLAAVRTALIRIGMGAGLSVSGIGPRAGDGAWTGLISQAGITVGLASVVASEFPGWGTQLQTLLIAVIPINEFVGPMLFRRRLARAADQETRSRRPLVVSNREPPHVRREDGSVTWTSATEASRSRSTR